MAENVKLEKEELEKLQIQKLDLFGKINALTQEFTKMEQVLIEKYGKDSVINIKTGEVKKK
jgi:hypothetical protein